MDDRPALTVLARKEEHGRAIALLSFAAHLIPRLHGGRRHPHEGTSPPRRNVIPAKERHPREGTSFPRRNVIPAKERHSREGTSPPRRRLTGVCIGFHVGAWRVTSRSDLGSGQGSGSSHTRLQNRPRCSNHLSQAMPYRITLTVRPGFSRLLR